MKRELKNSPMEKAKQLTNLAAPDVDPQGSWTGQPVDPHEVPVQDADDL